MMDILSYVMYPLFSTALLTSLIQSWTESLLEKQAGRPTEARRGKREELMILSVF
jgi:hypothetical protein